MPTPPDQARSSDHRAGNLASRHALIATDGDIVPNSRTILRPGRPALRLS